MSRWNEVPQFSFHCSSFANLCKLSVCDRLFRLTCSWESSTEGKLAGHAGRM